MIHLVYLLVLYFTQVILPKQVQWMDSPCPLCIQPIEWHQPGSNLLAEMQMLVILMLSWHVTLITIKLLKTFYKYNWKMCIWEQGGGLIRCSELVCFSRACRSVGARKQCSGAGSGVVGAAEAGVC